MTGAEPHDYLGIDGGCFDARPRPQTPPRSRPEDRRACGSGEGEQG